MTMFGQSRLVRRHHTETDTGPEYEKDSDDAAVWAWNWVNDLYLDIFGVSPEVGFCKVYDASVAVFRNITERAWQAFTEMASWPAVATLQATDAIYFGNISWPSEATFEIDTPTTVATYTGDAATWEYWNGVAYVALTLLRDETDTTAFDGLRPFQGGGEITFNRPTDMASCDVDGQTAEWIRVRPTTPANVATVAIFSYTDTPEFVASAAYVDSGVTRANETLEDDITGALVSGVGETEVTITSSIGRKIKKVFTFVEPDSCREDDYGN